MHRRKIWRDPSNVRLDQRFVGIYERTQEILACSYYHSLIAAGHPNSICARLSRGAIHLYPVLILSWASWLLTASSIAAPQAMDTPLSTSLFFPAGSLCVCANDPSRNRHPLSILSAVAQALKKML